MRAIRKVPGITAYFRIFNLLSTAMGESTSDDLVRQINPVIEVAHGAIGLAAALARHLSIRRYMARFNSTMPTSIRG
jgi:uncharacterized membrane-anchored protein